MDGIRIDKWLWAARFFKTRALAARACELGRVQSNHQPVKPSREVRVGDFFRITREHDELHVQVLALSAIRGPATVAHTLYRETEESRELRLRLAQERKASGLFAPAPQGRPTKRDRRKIIQFRNNVQRNSQLDDEE
jgi:ribosome-associated heat shock protein Hsp15